MFTDNKGSLKTSAIFSEPPSAGYFQFSHIHSAKFIPQQRLWALIGKRFVLGTFFPTDQDIKKIQCSGKLLNVTNKPRGASPLMKKSTLRAQWYINKKEVVAQNATAILKQSTVPLLISNHYS